MKMSKNKKFFFEPFRAARFRLRYAQSSGRLNQKTFLLRFARLGWDWGL